MPSVNFWRKKKESYIMQQASELTTTKKLQKTSVAESWLPEEEVWTSYTSDMKAVRVLAPSSSSMGQPTCSV